MGVTLSSSWTMMSLLVLIVAFSPVYSQEINTSRVDAGHAPDSRFTLDAGGIVVPTNQSTSASTSTNQGTGVNQTPSASPTPTASPTTSTAYVFPTKKERFNRYVKSTVGPFSLLRVGFSAGINQWRDNPEEWEQGMQGYGRRFASGFGSNTIQQTVIYGLDSAMGLDTGFRKSTRTGFFPRLKHALAEGITSRTKTGKRVISVPRIAGAYSSRIIAYETWYPNRYDYKDGLRSGTQSLITGFGINLLREFVVRF